MNDLCVAHDASVSSVNEVSRKFNKLLTLKSKIMVSMRTFYSADNCRNTRILLFVYIKQNIDAKYDSLV